MGTDGQIIDAGYNLLGSNCAITETTTSRINSSRVFSDVVTPIGGDGLAYPRPGSPAIDGSSGGSCLVDTDQRGLSPAAGPACDIGAVESRGYSLTRSGGNNQGTLINSAFATPLQVTLSSNDSDAPLSGNRVIFTAPSDRSRVNHRHLHRHH
jgi:hypothetical protein